MFKIGCHLSMSKGYLSMGKEALSIKANTFQYFTRNPRGGAVKQLNLDDIEAFNNLTKEHSMFPPLAHAPYTLNPCAEKESIREFAKMVMEDDISRLEHIPGSMYNFHPGSHVKQGVEIGIQKIIDILNNVLKQDQKTIVLLEAMSGKGTEIGRSFEELKSIIDGVNHSHLIGVCIDTCHIYDAGYDIVNNLDGVLNDFDKIIGLERIKAVHVNDSKNPFKSHKDRHEKIGDGFIGKEAFERLINHPSLKDLPFYLETPNDIEGYAVEIEMLKNMRK
ncbi:MAG: deoxyribonuclease IV [Defluviitaleaceae bacterium]|nr:deoxyribonuclease IV [Defluviitaleaceae bacterium]